MANLAWDGTDGLLDDGLLEMGTRGRGYCISTGMHQKALPRLCEYGVKNRVLLTAVGKQNTI